MFKFKLAALVFSSIMILVVSNVAFAAPAQTAVTDVDLNNYELVATYLLPPGDFTTNPAVINAHEASAVTYNWDTNTLFVIGDEGGNIVEVSLTGELISKMTIIGFNDPEAITYTGGGNFVIVEERNRDAYQISYVANFFIFKNSLVAVDLGGFVENIGIEGISYDPLTAEYITVKEKLPQEINLNALNFSSGIAIINSLFIPNLGVADIADVQALSIVPTLTDDASKLLLISQESSKLLETDRNGNILSQFDLSAMSSTAEGVTIDFNGNIYVVAENGLAPQLFVLSPKKLDSDLDEDIPMSPMWALLLVGAILSFIGSRQKY